MFPRGIWKVAWLLLLAALAAIAFSAVVVDMTDGKQRFGKLGRSAVVMAKAPWTLEQMITENRRMYSEVPERLDGPPGWRFGAEGMPQDLPGHIRLSRFDGDGRDFATDTVSSPFRQAMENYEVQTRHEGLFDLLPGGYLMLEEENAGRLLVLAPSGDLVASYVNKGEDGKGRRMGWSRYVPEAQGDPVATKLRGLDCPAVH